MLASAPLNYFSLVGPKSRMNCGPWEKLNNKIFIRNGTLAPWDLSKHYVISLFGIGLSYWLL